MDCVEECRDKSTSETLGGAAVVPAGKDGKATDSSDELKQADVEEVEEGMTAVSLAIGADAATRDPQAGAWCCAAELQGGTHAGLAIGVSVTGDATTKPGRAGDEITASHDGVV